MAAADRGAGGQQGAQEGGQLAGCPSEGGPQAWIPRDSRSSANG